MYLAITISAFFIAWVGTLAVEHQAHRLSLIRAPNARSSHTRPTPRGGGLAIAIATIAVATALALSGAQGLWSVAILTAIIAALGFADDLHDISPALRFPIQGLVIAALLWVSGPLPAIALSPSLALAGLLLAALVLLIGLWWLNLFNFMDGIDGIAGSQAILLLGCGIFIWWSTDPAAVESEIFVLALASAPSPCSAASRAGSGPGRPTVGTPINKCRACGAIGA